MSDPKIVASLKTIIDQGAIWGGIDGEIKDTPFKKFSIPPELYKHFIKNLVGASGLGALHYKSSQTSGGATLTFDAGNTGIGLILEVAIKRDETLGLFKATYKPASAGADSFELPIIPKSIYSTYFLFSAYTSKNEVFPTLQNVPSIAVDASIPDASTITATLLDLGNTNVVDLIKML